MRAGGVFRHNNRNRRANAGAAATGAVLGCRDRVAGGIGRHQEMPCTASDRFAILDLGDGVDQQNVERKRSAHTHTAPFGAAGDAGRRGTEQAFAGGEGMDIHIATMKGDLGRVCRRRALVATNDRQMVNVGHADGHRTGHPDVATAGAGFGFSAHRVGAVHQLLGRVASVAQRDRLAGQRVFTAGCEFGPLVVDDDHEVGGAVVQTAHLGTAAVSVDNRIAGAQVATFAQSDDTTLAGVENDLVFANAQQAAVFKLVTSSCAGTVRATQVHPAFIATRLGMLFGVVERNGGAVFSQAGVVVATIVEAADLGARAVLVGDLVTRLEAVALADENGLGGFIHHRHLGGFEAHLALCHGGFKAQAIGLHLSTGTNGGFVAHRGHRHRHTNAHPSAAIAGDGSAVCHCDRIGQVARMQYHRTTASTGASRHMDKLRDIRTRSGTGDSDRNCAGHTDRAARGIRLGRVGFLLPAGFGLRLATVVS